MSGTDQDETYQTRADPSRADLSRADLSKIIDTLYRYESGRILATLVRLLGDLDLAEEAMHEAFAAALEFWPQAGIPEKPRPWLISTARFKAIDAIRRRARFDGVQKDLALHIEAASSVNKASQNAGSIGAGTISAETMIDQEIDAEIEDERLRLIFTCCHPALPPEAQVALTLREVCGLTTEEIARAFLVTPATLAQRIVRAKAVIRDKAIPYQVPAPQELPARLAAVLQVVYLVFNAGYSAEASGAELSREAIRLGRLLLDLMNAGLINSDLTNPDLTNPDLTNPDLTNPDLTNPDLGNPAVTSPDVRDKDVRKKHLLQKSQVTSFKEAQPEVVGLLALMLLQESRRAARTSSEGDLILLEQQDRSLWNKDQIAEGIALTGSALRSHRFGPYTLQAAIAAVHAGSSSAASTDWREITLFYDRLLRVHSSPVVELNRAVAVAMCEGPEHGLRLIDDLLARKNGELANYYLAHSARADLCRRLGRIPEARTSYEKALALLLTNKDRQEPERRFLARRIDELG